MYTYKWLLLAGFARDVYDLSANILTKIYAKELFDTKKPVFPTLRNHRLLSC